MFENEEIKCDICDKTGFKSKAGLAGHKKIIHGADTRTRKTVPDEIGRRLGKIERALNRLVTARVTDDMVKESTRKGLSGDDTYVLLKKKNYALIKKCIGLFFSESDYDEKTLGEYFTKALEK